MFRLTPVVKNLLIINIAIFFISYLLRVNTGFDVIENFGLYYIGSDNFKAWQFVTYMFLHSYIEPLSGGMDFSHIFGNMLGLFIFGTWLEDIWGPKRFFEYYLITGLGAGILFMGVEYFEKQDMQEAIKVFREDPTAESFNALVLDHFEAYYNHPQVESLINEYDANPTSERLKIEALQRAEELYVLYMNIPMVGASGAIFGILLAAGLLFPYRRLILLFPPIPLRARILVIFYGAYEVYAIIQRAPNDNVAHFAHLGGMLVGFILLVMWGEDKNRYE